MTIDAPLPGMIGHHPSMQAVYRQARLVAPTPLSVLISGETGTGKELVARALHELGADAGGPFIDINCAAITETLAEAELFGAEKDAYTGIRERRLGYLERANGGTLFLDEAGEISKPVQAKLLRAIERGEFWRVGSGPLVKSRFRLILASSTPLDELRLDGRYRAEFFYRVAEVDIKLPPLRSRGADIRLLAEFFSADASAGPPKGLSADALALLSSHPWPGNIRELRIAIRRARMLVTGELVTAAAVSEALASLSSTPEVNRDRALEVLASCGGNQSAAARILRVPRSTLRDLIRVELSAP